ncbi:glutathione S-transferase family protein [Cohaesibacter celericrescens]|uniref:glutathione transferase n=1 Tax=Cohaesibacter celericrescens TaxID=2067669 RepID=A0A2N5XT27_9HYPH|nr:glutathione S-transferase [Cohaesibacter celericrescens]PLW77607.1 glutathione S-transferase [Cohaesibacter celericrescens]
MIKVHYLGDSRAHRILWLLEELSVDYDVVVYKRGPDYLAPASLKAIHPLGKSPIIEDGDLLLAESGAIIDYLVERYGKDAGLKPDTASASYWRYNYWLHYCEGSAMPLVTNKLLFELLPSKTPFFVRPIAKLICKGVMQKLIDPAFKDHITHWNKELCRDGWFACGDFSAADIAMSFVVEAAVERFEIDLDIGAVRQFIDRIRTRPAYQCAVERGGIYRLANSK